MQLVSIAGWPSQKVNDIGAQQAFLQSYCYRRVGQTTDIYGIFTEIIFALAQKNGPIVTGLALLVSETSNMSPSVKKQQLGTIEFVLILSEDNVGLIAYNFTEQTRF